MTNLPESDSLSVGSSVIPADDRADREYTKRRAQIAVLVAVLIILLLLLCGVGYLVTSIISPKGSSSEATATGSESLQWVRSIYGWGAGETEKFEGPTRVAVGPDGTIWTDVLAPGLVIGVSPDGQYRHMLGLDVATREHILIRPTGIDVAENGDIYVADEKANSIFVFSEDGRVLRSWSVAAPRDLDLSGEKVYVLGLGGVGIFNTSGEILSSVGTYGGGPEEFRHPRSIAVDDETGAFYICDTMNTRVKGYDSDGELQWIQPDFAQDVKLKEGNLSGPMSTDASGTVPFNLPMGAVLDGNGRLIVIDAFLFDMAVMDVDEEGEITDRYGTDGSTDGKFFYPSDLDYDANRDWIVVADTNNDRLQVFRLSGTASANVKSAYLRLNSAARWVCCLPLLLLLLLLLLIALRSRSRKRAQLDEGTYDDDLAVDAV